MTKIACRVALGAILVLTLSAGGLYGWIKYSDSRQLLSDDRIANVSPQHDFLLCEARDTSPNSPARSAAIDKLNASMTRCSKDDKRCAGDIERYLRTYSNVPNKLKSNINLRIARRYGNPDPDNHSYRWRISALSDGNAVVFIYKPCNYQLVSPDSELGADGGSASDESLTG